MAEGAAINRHGPLSNELRNCVRAFAAATDNVGLFFGEDMFVAFGGIMLMHTLLADMKVDVTPVAIAMWGIPTALAAFLIHAVRLYRLDGYLARAVDPAAASRRAAPVTTTPTPMASESEGH
jgi:uncharacterized membrane protein